MAVVEQKMSCHVLTLVPIFLLLVYALFAVSPFIDRKLSVTKSSTAAPTAAPPSAAAGVTVLHSRRNASGVERIEEELARARAAIREAIRSRSYRSYKEEGFVPRGAVYRNPIAFQQSHIEMVKRFKVWTYKEGERPLVHRAPMNNIYSIEGQFLDEMESGKSPFRARTPDEAHVFYLPFSVASIIHFIYQPILSKKDYDRGRLHRIVDDYVGVVAGKYPYWNRSGGADHFMVSCHDWAPEVSTANPKFYSKFIRVLCNANTSEGFRPSRDASLPELYLQYGQLGPTPTQSRSDRPPSNRTILAFFSGGAHGYIRRLLFDHWKNQTDPQVQVFEHLPNRAIYTAKMGSSKFCLCPSGYEVASPRIVEAINHGCVPVLISANYSLPFAEVLDWSEFTVSVPVERIGEMKEILEGVSEERYLEMYERVKGVRRHFVLNRPAKAYDLLHMVLHSLWLRRLNVRL
ncbi:unnamed protein product [Linum tenue]|uniref:Exostosin GT47 domain-containing protein n=4 Tax=Linum tenue TaxID=586396 RepID=A0AAV0HW00_9ROSI|nr:unnamed protein product [Linum tenue]